jgi:hypothetical protein
MTEYQINHLMDWAATHRFLAMETVNAIMGFLARLDKEDVQDLLERRSWSEIEELTFR